MEPMKTMVVDLSAMNDIIKELTRKGCTVSEVDHDNDEELDNVYLGMDYDQVIFNPPATIVLWSDGTKTVVRCGERDKYDKEKGLALCFMKKALGNTSRALNDVLHAEIKHEEDAVS